MVAARLVISRRFGMGDDGFASIVIWEVPKALRGSEHRYKYRLALVVADICVLRFDNEAGKGDHKHVGKREYPYDFVGIDQLQRDFLLEAERWLLGHPRR